MTSGDVRKSFLAFFKDRGHRIVPSAPVIPYDDPTLLFTNAGMNQFKDVFLGTGKRDYVRAADSQKCIRVSGKHNDLEEVGRDTYHHTFFEMLGNWSFGDYYKKEAIEWAWELLTRVWGLEKRRLYATVYESDDEAADLWKSVTDIDPAHIQRFGKKDNFWEMGETGPCGPCSEIHIDLTPDCSGGNLVNAGDPRVMEIWNLVFIQYNRDDKGELSPLPAKHVDTGMGFERVCAVLQGKTSNYESDVFTPIIRHIASVVGKEYLGTLDGGSDIAMRVIADHVRMLSFSIADGAIPSNEGRGYVMRRILRRAARFGRNLGMREPFLHKVVSAVVASMGEQFPELKDRQEHIERVIHGEEESFNATLDRGLEIFESVVKKLGASAAFPGDEAFRLYDTYGFPLDLTELMASERGLKVDAVRFTELMEEQKERARGARSADSPIHAVSFESRSKSAFTGYNALESQSEILEVIPGQALGTPESDFIVLRETPFYAESGGQVSDSGTIEIPGLGKTLAVRSVLKNPGGAVAHVVPAGSSLRPGMAAVVRVDTGRRARIMRNHSATHLVHEALRRILGTHLHQQGSSVDDHRLRFDFNHFEKITPDSLRAIEDIVNEKIALAIAVNALNDPSEWLTIDQAKAKYPNVKMFFGDKYGDRVRIVEIDPGFSVELCGGTHVGNTRDIGLFKIISEGSVASGIRRIEAVTGDGLREYLEKQIEKADGINRQIEELLKEEENLASQLNHQLAANRYRVDSSRLQAELTPGGVKRIETALRDRESVVEEITRSIIDLRKSAAKARLKEAAGGVDDLVAAAQPVGGFNFVATRVETGSMDELKGLGDALRLKLGSGVGILGAVLDEKAAFVCVVTDDLISGRKLQAGKIVGELARKVGGGGGGRPHLATAGGKDVARLDETLAGARSVVESMLGSS